MGRAGSSRPEKAHESDERYAMTNDNEIQDEVRRYYAAAAVVATDGKQACCGPEASLFGAHLYDGVEELPEAAVLASLGCGNPTFGIRLSLRLG